MRTAYTTKCPECRYYTLAVTRTGHGQQGTCTHCGWHYDRHHTTIAITKGQHP